MNQQALSKARSHFEHSPFEKMFRATVEMRYCREHKIAALYGCQLLAVDGSGPVCPLYSKFLAEQDAMPALPRQKLPCSMMFSRVRANMNQIIASLREHLITAYFAASEEERERVLLMIGLKIQRSVVPVQPERTVERSPTPRKVTSPQQKIAFMSLSC